MGQPFTSSKISMLFPHTEHFVFEAVDILNYKNLNFAGVLIATALYDGTINIEKVSNFSI